MGQVKHSESPQSPRSHKKQERDSSSFAWVPQLGREERLRDPSCRRLAVPPFVTHSEQAQRMMGHESFSDLDKWEISTDKGKPWAYDRMFGPYCSTIYIARNNQWVWEFSPEEYIADQDKRIVLQSGHPCPTVDTAMRNYKPTDVSWGFCPSLPPRDAPGKSRSASDPAKQVVERHDVGEDSAVLVVYQAEGRD